MSSKGVQNFLKAARDVIKRSTSRQLKGDQLFIRKDPLASPSAQNGRLNSKTFQPAGWINSCWIQLGQVGKLPKTKFHAATPNSPDQSSFSSWNTVLKRYLRRKHSPEDTSHLKPSSANRSISFPPLPKSYNRMDYYQLIWKPVAFTAFVGTASVIGCTIWQYEEYRSHVNRGRFSFSNFDFGSCTESTSQRQPPSRQQSQLSTVATRVQTWWKDLCPAEKVFWPICALNGAVFLAWRSGVLSSLMISYFSCTPTSRAVCWPMLLSTFSHYSFFHLAANMFVLHSFIPAAVQIMGKEQFVAYYLTSGTFASLGSHLHKLVIRSSIPSLGASGAIMGILGLVCTRMPETQLGIIFLPGAQFSADTALKCIMAVDTVGLIAGWKFMDHAAHLAGCLFGVGFSHYGKDTFWVFRDKVMTLWHKLRTEQV